MHYYHNQYWKSVSPNGMKSCMIWHLNELFSLLFTIQKYRQTYQNRNFNFIIRFDFEIPIFLDSVKITMFSSLHAYFESLTKEWYKLTRTSSFVLSETKRQKCPFFLLIWKVSVICFSLSLFASLSISIHLYLRGYFGPRAPLL